jgi:hypothetical protein
MVQAHDNGRQAAAPEPINHKALGKLKASHGMDAKALKSSLGSALSSGDTEGHDGKPMTYGDVKGHLNTMRMQLGSKPEHAEHLKHAQYALNQSFGLNHAPVSEKHAKLIGAALSGKTRMDDNGVVQHAGGAAAPKPAAGGGGYSVAKQAAAKTASAAPQKAAAPGPMTPDAVKEHALQSGAKWKSNVAVFSRPESAHSFAETAAASKGGAFVMKHPNHAHHVVVGGADSQRMSKNGYEYVRPVMKNVGTDK